MGSSESVNPPKCDDLDYINFLIASFNVFTCTEAEKCQPLGEDSPSHDAFTRLLQRQPPDTDALWNEVNVIVQPHKGVLVADDSVLDKPYAKNMDLVYRQWSGKQHKTVNGINLNTLLWTDGNAMIPVDFRIYDIEVDNKTKNDHFRDMLYKAKERGFKPDLALFDSWYSGIDNLKTIRKLGWHWLTRLKKNRLVNPDNTKNIQIQYIDIPPEGREVHLKAYGFIKVFKIVSKDGDIDYWATDMLEMDEPERKKMAGYSWKIEEYHRGIKQFCGVERCQARKGQCQRAHIMFSLRAFLRLEVERLKTGASWFESKRRIIRNAIQLYLKYPYYSLPGASTA
jgi:putative transposase